MTTLNIILDLIAIVFLCGSLVILGRWLRDHSKRIHTLEDRIDAMPDFATATIIAVIDMDEDEPDHLTH